MKRGLTFSPPRFKTSFFRPVITSIFSVEKGGLGLCNLVQISVYIDRRLHLQRSLVTWPQDCPLFIDGANRNARRDIPGSALMEGVGRSRGDRRSLGCAVRENQIRSHAGPHPF